MSRLKLAEPDRERLGCPEFLPNPLDTVTVREAMELQKLGYTTPTLLAKSLVVSKDGEGPDYNAWVAFVWLALRRVGVQCDPATLDFDVVGMSIEPDEEVPERVVASGKAPARGRSRSSARTNSTNGATSPERSTLTDLAS